ncbi:MULTISPECIES: MBL fold metallo-hydrolase [Thermocrispum]|jgi:glyoxylase-like metal-dependent hydrolase (beta-lactamase superfamily II)|uniref:MBL fold metallo-hydrolase n=1 Tax=Thermocrispum agreste TaxID=37925 RepID=A0A2W4JMX3_9PSEU|nr:MULTISPECIES: MBL fold metallo-hydrolase [Thermocrispum]PZN00435.1 MAG: MBL fold metallo-hydrolase [Thermocrispum agreste]
MSNESAPGRWLVLADGVYARRYAELDQTLGLVVGRDRALVVDTGRDEEHGAEFASAVAGLTALPLTVVVTHAHFDHCLGTAAFPGAEVWAHERCRVDERVFVERAEYYPGAPPVRLVQPTHRVREAAELDLGGQTVRLVHPGRAHTDHDLAVHVPDARVLFTGDLVEQGADPSIGPDSFPQLWPHALDELLRLDAATFVPGHGDPVDRAFVERQRDLLSAGST